MKTCAGKLPSISSPSPPWCACAQWRLGGSPQALAPNRRCDGLDRRTIMTTTPSHFSKAVSKLEERFVSQNSRCSSVLFLFWHSSEHYAASHAVASRKDLPKDCAEREQFLSRTFIFSWWEKQEIQKLACNAYVFNHSLPGSWIHHFPPRLNYFTAWNRSGTRFWWFRWACRNQGKHRRANLVHTIASDNQNGKCLDAVAAKNSLASRRRVSSFTKPGIFSFVTVWHKVICKACPIDK